MNLVQPKKYFSNLIYFWGIWCQIGHIGNLQYLWHYNIVKTLCKLHDEWIKKKSKTVTEKKGIRKKGYSLKGWAIKKGGGVKAGPKGKKTFLNLYFYFVIFIVF